MEQQLFQKDGSYSRLGFLLSSDGILTPFGYRDLYDVILYVGYENIDYLYHNTALLEELKNSDKTIVIVSHSLDSIRKLCNRAIWIKDGHVKMDGEANSVIDKYLEECK